MCHTTALSYITIGGAEVTFVTMVTKFRYHVTDLKVFAAVATLMAEDVYRTILSNRKQTASDTYLTCTSWNLYCKGSCACSPRTTQYR